MSKKLTKEEFVKKSIAIHGDKYSYEKVIYINNIEKVIIICNKHGEFLQSPNKHLQNRCCYSCGRESMGKKQTLTTAKFIEKAKIKHGELYDYTDVDYKSTRTKISIICKVHGTFSQTPNNHLNGAGCSDCFDSVLSDEFIKARDKLDNKIHSYDEFVKRAIAKHGNQYDYSKSIFLKGGQLLYIICKKHGSFQQTPIRHCNSGYGCPKCVHIISKSEIAWLNYLKIDEKYRHKILFIDGKKYNVDAYDSSTNTIYEFHGDYWHGNPIRFNPNDINKNNKKTFGELYRRIIEREKYLKSLGYNVVSIWENDWKNIGQ